MHHLNRMDLLNSIMNLPRQSWNYDVLACSEKLPFFVGWYRYPVISYHVHFIFGVTSYQREKLCSLHPMFTSYLESLHTLSHFIFGVTAYIESLHTSSHFIPGVTSYPKSLHTWRHFIPRTISYHGPLHTMDYLIHFISWTTSYHTCIVHLIRTIWYGQLIPKCEFQIGPHIGNQIIRSWLEGYKNSEQNVSQNYGFIKVIIPTKSEASCSQNSKYTVFLRKVNDPKNLKVNGLLLKIYGHYRKIYGPFQIVRSHIDDLKYMVLPKLP